MEHLSKEALFRLTASNVREFVRYYVSWIQTDLALARILAYPMYVDKQYRAIKPVEI